MNQTQLQQEPETTLPRIEPSQCDSGTADVAMPLEADEVTSEESTIVEKLLAVMGRNTCKRKQWNSITSGIYTVIALVYISLRVIGWSTGRNYVSDEFLYIAGLFNIFGWAIGAFLLDRKAADQLTQLDDLRCVGPLIEIWKPDGTLEGQFSYSRNTRRQAEVALTRLLPRLKASDAPLLKEYQRVILRNVLAMDGYKGWNKYYNEAFLLAIIEAFAQIGDWKSFTQVRRLTVTAKYASVRKTAQDCLPFLENLAMKQTPGETLLRASSAVDAASVKSETLLRPASSSTDAQLETLLRPLE